MPTRTLLFTENVGLCGTAGRKAAILHHVLQGLLVVLRLDGTKEAERKKRPEAFQEVEEHASGVFDPFDSGPTCLPAPVWLHWFKPPRDLRDQWSCGTVTSFFPKFSSKNTTNTSHSSVVSLCLGKAAFCDVDMVFHLFWLDTIVLQDLKSNKNKIGAKRGLHGFQ